MARLLSCPYCFAEFTLDDWSRKASCPACCRRVTFFEASGAAAIPAAGVSGQAEAPGSGGSGPSADLATGIGASLPAAPSTAAAAPRTLFGKPRGWSRGWTVVIVVWAAVAALLVAARVEMGELTALTTDESRAIDDVAAATIPGTETSYDRAILELLRRADGIDAEAGGPPETGWWAFTRSWEERVYVLFWMEWPDGSGLALGWWVENGEVVADPATERFLSALVDDDRERDPGWPDPPGFLNE